MCVCVCVCVFDYYDGAKMVGQKARSDGGESNLDMAVETFQGH